MSDWNTQTITDFRENEGRVGGPFQGAPIVLLHHRGRKSGREYVTPTMYLAHEADPDIIYVFATKGGAPTNPDWYINLTTAGHTTIERGTETYDVTVHEVTGPDRDRIYAVHPASPNTNGKPKASAPSRPRTQTHLSAGSSTDRTRPDPGHGWICEPTPRSRRTDSRIRKAVLAV
jgi:deazaflavin-dependent oxidoreductase (nitroreductase family)